MTYAQFQKRASLSRADICQEILGDHRGSIKTKKEPRAVKNLELIFDATLQVSNRKGFQAMTMRDLSQASGLSMGALYSYFSSKEELLEMVQSTGRKVTGRLLAQGVEGVEDPVERLTAAVRTHVFLSEAMQPWFFFSYMEARHLGERQKELAKQGELATERLFADIVREGAQRGMFVERDPHLTAALIKAMLQDWYLKRWKHAGRRVSADRYAQEVVRMILAYCLGAPAGQQKDEKP